MRCWFWNINMDAQNYFANELDNGRLRQGWGYEDRLDLRKLKAKLDAGSSLDPDETGAWTRCSPMLIEIQQDDFVAVKNIPSKDFFTIVKVKAGYDFNRDPALGDYGHLLPVEKIRQFHKRSALVEVPFIRALTREQNPIRVTYRHHSTFMELATMQVSRELAETPSEFKERINSCRNDLIAQLRKSV